MAAERSRVFADLLRAARRAAGLTQEELAERAGLSVRAVRKLESGAIQTPRRDTIALLAAALDLGEPEHATFAQAARGPTNRPAPQPGQLVASTAERPLVGRIPEQARLASHLTGQGPPLLLLAGEPGIGKTRLLQESAARARVTGWTVLVGGCTRRSGQEPYAPLLAALARFLVGRPAARLRADLESCAWLVRLLPELAERAVVPLPSWTLPPEQERRLMFAAAARFLANVAGPAGTLLVLDDLQWAGADALDLLAALLHSQTALLHPQAGPVRVIGAYRTTEVGTAHPLAGLRADLAREVLTEELPLGPLALAEARALVDGLLPATLQTSALAAQVVERAGGVPFFLVSSARALADPEVEDGGAAAHLPWTVRQSILQRVAGLPETARALLGLAAVGGRELSRPVLLAAAAGALGTERAALLTAIEAACGSGLLAEDERGDYRFGHDLVREVMLADLGAARRAVCHLAWAEALEGTPAGARPELAAQLAHHFVRGDAPTRAVRYLVRAGDHARALRAHEEALSHYRELTELLDHLDRVAAAAAREKLGGLLATLGRYDVALAELDRAEAAYRSAGDLEGAGRVAAQVGQVHASRNTPERGGAHIRAVLDGADAGALSLRTRASLHLALAHVGMVSGHYALMLAAAEQAATLARDAGEAALLAVAEKDRATALDMLGRGEEAVPLYEAALPALEAAGELSHLARALNNVAVLLEVRGAPGVFAKTRRYLERAVEVAERSDDPVLLAFMIHRCGINALATGDWDRAEADLARAMALLRQVGTSWASSFALIGVARLALARGRWDEALGAFGEVHTLSESTDNAQVLHPLHIALTEWDLLQGRPEAARARLEALLERSSHELDPGPVEAFLAWALAELGEMDRAEPLVARAVEAARAGGALLELIEPLRIQALVATRVRQWDMSAAALDEALAICRPMPNPHAEAKALYVYGQLHAARGEPEQAHEQYQAALAICQRLGEGLYRPHIERALELLG